MVRFLKNKEAVLKGSIILILAATASCTPETVSRGIKARTEERNVVIKQPTLSTVDLNSDGITITGTNLDNVTKVQITGSGYDKTFALKTQTSSLIQGYISNIPALQILAGFTYNLIISTASAQTVFPITFSILDNTVTASKIASSAVETAKIKTKAVTYEKIDTTGAVNGYVLTYNSSTGKWQASAPSTTPSGGTMTSITAGTGIKASSGSTITTSGTLSVNIGTTADFIPYFNSDGWIVSDEDQGGMHFLQEETDGGSFLRFTHYEEFTGVGFSDLDDTVNTDVFISAQDDGLYFCSDTSCSDTYFYLDSAGGASIYGLTNFYEDPGSGNFASLGYIKDTSNDSGLQVNGGYLCVGTSSDCDNDETATVKLRVHGSAFNSSGSSTWGALSDRRYKIIDGNFEKGLKEISQLDLYRWHYDPSKIPGADLRQNVGPVAQEVQKLFPEAVSKGGDGRLILNPDSLWWAGLNAVKELDQIRVEQAKEIELLKEKNLELEERLERLENLVGKK
jgi:hypothetical protein